MKRVVGVAVLALAAFGMGYFALNEPGILERAVGVGQGNDGRVKLKARLLHRDDTAVNQQTSQITNLSGMTVELSSLCARAEATREEDRCAEVAGKVLGPGQRFDAAIALPRELQGENLQVQLEYLVDGDPQVLLVKMRPSGSIPVLWMATGMGVAGLMTLAYRHPRRRRQA